MCTTNVQIFFAFLANKKNDCKEINDYINDLTTAGSQVSGEKLASWPLRSDLRVGRVPESTLGVGVQWVLVLEIQTNIFFNKIKVMNIYFQQAA